MMDDVYIYHAHTMFLLSQYCADPHIHSSTSRSYELTKRALESNEAMGSLGALVIHPPLRKDFTLYFYMALTWFWVIYHFSHYTHISMFNLHDMLIPMPLTCMCDPCFPLHMIQYPITSLCIHLLGGYICFYCHVICVPHAIIDTSVGRVMLMHCSSRRTPRQHSDTLGMMCLVLATCHVLCLCPPPISMTCMI